MNYKTQIIFPVLFLVASIIYLVYLISTTGLNLDIDLKGGTQISFESSSELNEQNLENIFRRNLIAIIISFLILLKQGKQINF